MYSPTTRLLAVLALLQTHQQMSGAEIARRLEVDVRTVRRYITSLQDMGVPVEGERGPHGAYYLGRGSKMPPLMFTNEEAVALVLGLHVIREFQFPVNRSGYRRCCCQNRTGSARTTAATGARITILYHIQREQLRRGPSATIGRRQYADCPQYSGAGATSCGIRLSLVAG
jgi:biotin operon repressor